MSSSVYQQFDETVAARGAHVAALVKQDGSWREMTWRELGELARSVSAGLVEIGVQPGQMVAVIANTRLEWCVADLGIIGAGATTVPIYQSSTAADVQYILNDANSVAIFVEDEAQLAKVRAIRREIPSVSKIIAITGRTTGPDEISWEELLEAGRRCLSRRESEVRARSQRITRDDILTLIYTSGTTGLPKGVMITHDNMLYEAEACVEIGLIRADHVQYLFLPLAHVFGKLLEVAWFRTGHTMAFWERDMARIVPNLAEVRPTLVCAVPRIFEKIYARVVDEIRTTAGVRGQLARWGLRQEARAAAAEQQGGRPGLAWSIARALVFSKLHARLHERFGGRVQFFVSGGAPLSRDIAYFFAHAGVTICEGYGLTESSAASTVNRPDNVRMGTVGRAVPGTEVRIAADGEILIRGRGVMRGYYNRPGPTAEAIDGDGWLHTGDIGAVDGDGSLRITDRKKDIIVTAGGKNIAPQKIESLIKSANPLVSHVVVHGDRRKFLSALVTVDEEAVRRWAAAQALPGDYESLTQSERLRTEVDAAIRWVNAGLASYETVKAFKILDHDFVVGDQLTPSLKVKRKLCGERYKAIFDGFYAEGDEHPEPRGAMVPV